MINLFRDIMKGGRIVLTPWRVEGEGLIAIVAIFTLALIALVA
jgi:hypothetical protein